MDRFFSQLNATILCGSLALCSAPARAAAPEATSDAAPTGDEARGKQLFENGRRLFDEGSYEAAIVAFNAAYELLKEPNLLFNIHLAHEKMGNFQAAIEFLDRYRAFAPESEQEELSRTRESLDTRRRRAEEPDETAPAVPTPVVEPPEEQPLQDPVPDEKPPKIVGPGVIVAAVIAGAAAATGLGLGLVSRSRRNSAEDACSNNLCREGFVDDADASQNLALGANVSFGVAGAATLIAVTLIAVNASRRPGRGDARARLVPTGGGVALHF